MWGQSFLITPKGKDLSMPTQENDQRDRIIEEYEASGLSPQEAEIQYLLDQGLSDLEVAERLDVHRSQVYVAKDRIDEKVQQAARLLELRHRQSDASALPADGELLAAAFERFIETQPEQAIARLVNEWA